MKLIGNMQENLFLDYYFCMLRNHWISFVMNDKGNEKWKIESHRRGKRVKEGESWNTTFMQFSFCFICTAWSICRASLNSFSLRQSEVSSSTLWLQVKSKKVFPGKPYPPCHKKQDNTKRRYRLSYNMPISFNHSILLRKLPCRKIINISNRELIWPSI